MSGDDCCWLLLSCCIDGISVLRDVYKPFCWHQDKFSDKRAGGTQSVKVASVVELLRFVWIDTTVTMTLVTISSNKVDFSTNTIANSKQTN